MLDVIVEHRRGGPPRITLTSPSDDQHPLDITRREARGRNLAPVHSAVSTNAAAPQVNAQGARAG